ncbi:hypothetical protein ACWZEH_01130 [Streptomyces sp. QTS137]
MPTKRVRQPVYPAAIGRSLRCRRRRLCPYSAIEKLVSRLRPEVDQERPALIRARRSFGCWLGHPARRNAAPAR